MEYRDKRLVFGDYGRARSLIGADATSLITLVEMKKLVESYEAQEGRHEPFIGMWFPSDFFSAFSSFYKDFGLEEVLHAGMLSGVGIFYPIHGRDSPTFLSLGTTFPKDPVIAKLLESGSEEAVYRGVTYYTRNEDYIGSLEDPLSRFDPILNRVAFIDNRFLAAPATFVMTSLIDAEHGTSSSLADNRAHKALAQAVGPDLVAGIFWPFAAMNSDWAPGSIADYRGSVIMDGLDRWESLSVYEVVLVGYRIREGVDEIVSALFYPDPEAAEGDSAKLKHRWETYVTGERYEGNQLAQACAPVSTKVIEGEDFSILETSCPVLWNTDESRHPFQSSTLWKNMSPEVFTQDIEKLKAAMALGQE
ncbi:MAG: hypothetical protein O7E55_08790 [Chloroflexi bacterium]|nr:hypothetical protein [Chloroflexota bacterium]